MVILMLRFNVTGGWFLRTIIYGVDDKKALLHDKRWYVYVNEM